MLAFKINQNAEAHAALPLEVDDIPDVGDMHFLLTNARTSCRLVINVSWKNSWTKSMARSMRLGRRMRRGTMKKKKRAPGVTIGALVMKKTKLEFSELNVLIKKTVTEIAANRHGDDKVDRELAVGLERRGINSTIVQRSRHQQSLCDYVSRYRVRKTEVKMRTSNWRTSR